MPPLTRHSTTRATTSGKCQCVPAEILQLIERERLKVMLLWARERIARYKLPKSVDLIDALPRTSCASPAGAPGSARSTEQMDGTGDPGEDRRPVTERSS
jgi:hypothetical protein